MLTIQQITSININLLLVFAMVIFLSLGVNYILRGTIKKNYSGWIDCILLLGSLFIGAVFKISKIEFALLLFWGLFALSLMDIFYRILPTRLNATLLILGLIINSQHKFITLDQAILGALAGYIILWSVSFFYKNSTGKLGIGDGDLKLTSALGAWIGLDEILYLLFWSSLLGCGFYCVMHLKGEYTRESKLPFGLFLSIVGMSIFILRFSLWFS